MIQPTTYDRLQACYKRFDSYPEQSHVKGGVVIKTDAFLAFLEARRIIETEVRDHAWQATRHWRELASFFTAEPETPMVLLFCPGEPEDCQVKLGYWDEDERAWYREGRGASDEAEPLLPAKWMPVSDLMLPEEEWVAVPRMEG